MPLVAGLDFGGGAVKACVADAERGEVLAVAQEPTETRHPPHIPVPSTMIGFRDAIVWMPTGRVTSATALIMGTGPAVSTTSIGSDPLSTSSASLPVTNPL